MAIEFAEANSGTGGAKFAVDNITEGVNTLAVPYVKLMSGTDTSNAVIPGDATNGLDVDVTRVSGNVTVVQPTAANLNATVSGTVTVQQPTAANLNATVTGTVNAAQSGTWSVNADTELPAAAALTDATANPTVPAVGSFPHVFNGTTWDRARGDTTNGLDVDVTRVQGSVTIKADTLANQTSDLKITLDGEAVVLGAGAATIGAVNQAGTWITADRLVSGQLADSAGAALTVKTTFANPATSGNTTLVAAVAGKKIRVLGYRLQAAGTVNVKFVDTAATPSDLSQLWEFQAREGAVVTAPPGGFEFETGVDLGVQINLSAAVSVHVSLIYVEV